VLLLTPLAYTFAEDVSQGDSMNEVIESGSYQRVSIIGGGIIGALEAYAASQEAQKNGDTICITVYEKSKSFSIPAEGDSSTNTSYNIVPSLTPDEILSVVPRGAELARKLNILFSEPFGIRVDDVPQVTESAAGERFKNAVAIYGQDKNHDDRTQALLKLGKMSMDLWQEMYDHADADLKAIFHDSNFNPCRAARNTTAKTLHDGYRIDLIYGMPNAKEHATAMMRNYLDIGYTDCTLLSPDEVMEIDPFMSDFCNDHSVFDEHSHRIWKRDCMALWRPGGCLDMRAFMPKFYEYLKNKMGQYQNASGEMEDRFKLQFESEVVGVEFNNDPENLRIIGLKFSNGSVVLDNPKNANSQYIFCPGESVGTLKRLGFNEPAYAGFAGTALSLNIPITSEQFDKYKNFASYMEVHGEGLVLPWQIRVLENRILIGTAGTKAFYADVAPDKNEAFGRNRTLVELNNLNNVLPEFISLAFGYNTQGKELTASDLGSLEYLEKALCWVGRRAVAYDGFPTYGHLYHNNQVVTNSRCTTHLGSGGVSFGPASVFVSRYSQQVCDDPFIEKVLKYADSRRTPEAN